MSWGEAGPGRRDHGLRQRRPRLHGRRRPPLRHERAVGRRHALDDRRCAAPRASSPVILLVCGASTRDRSTGSRWPGATPTRSRSSCWRPGCRGAPCRRRCASRRTTRRQDAARELTAEHASPLAGAAPGARSRPRPRRRHGRDRRAARRFLHETYWLDGAHLICVGDRDLTSLAVATVRPGVQVTVVDVDERVLKVIRPIAREEGLNVQTAFADLRLGPRPRCARRATSRSPTRPTRPRASSCSPRGRCRCFKPEDAARVLDLLRPRRGAGRARLRRPGGAARAAAADRGALPAVQPLRGRGGDRQRERALRHPPDPAHVGGGGEEGRSSARIYSGGKARWSPRRRAPDLDSASARRDTLALDLTGHPAFALRALLAARASAHAARHRGPPDLSELYDARRRHLHPARGHAPARDRRSPEVKARQRVARGDHRRARR